MNGRASGDGVRCISDQIIQVSAVMIMKRFMIHDEIE